MEQAASLAPSPARSIPETVYDTTLDSQTQRQRSVSQERPKDRQEISPETSENPLRPTGADIGPELADVGNTLPSAAQGPSEQSDSAVDSSEQPPLPDVLGFALQQPIEVISSHEVTSSFALFETAVPSGAPQVEDGQARQDCDEDSRLQGQESQDFTQASLADHWDPGAIVQPSWLSKHPSPNLSQTAQLLENPGEALCEVNTVSVPSTRAGASGSSEFYPFPVSQAVDGATLQRGDIALDTDFSLEQNAQAVYSNNNISTQDDTTETIWPTIEKAQSSPGSRHDSSQDTPEPAQPGSISCSSSPIAPPPNGSLGTLASPNVPSRPPTPQPTSSVRGMKTPEEVIASLDRRFAEYGKERLRRRAERSMADAQSPDAIPATTAPAALATAATMPTGMLPDSSSLRHPSALPLTEGTRSPSTVPDRVPAPQAPTSLRTIALTQASKAPSGESLEESRVPSKDAAVESSAHTIPAVPAIITTEATMADISSSDNEGLNETSEQSETASEHSEDSLLEDDPDQNLAVNEKIIPLSLDGRQRDEYCMILGGKKEMLVEFLHNMQSFEPLAEIEVLLSKLRNLENHFDLIYEEASLSANDEADDDTKRRHAVSFGLENSVKFRFLWTLFTAMRSQDKHILLVTQDDSDALYHRIDQACRVLDIRYKMPTNNRQADQPPADGHGDLLVTIFPMTSSPIIKPADLIICLDGAQEATQIRQKNWAINPKMDFVPVFHLVIPRTVSHIERCLSPLSNDRKRMHTIIASLQYMVKELGTPINGEDIKAIDAATRVAEWLDNSSGEEWPLGSIGSVTEVIEFATQKTQGSPTPTPPPPERLKRPHEEEALDPAKRMRFTPQPPDALLSSANEVTRISDSMPGTAADDASTLRAQLASMESILKKERVERLSEQSRFHETEIMWNRQQTAYEDLSRQHRLLQSSLKESNDKVDALTKSNESYSVRLTDRTQELRVAAAQLREERETHLLSHDEKVAEVAKLRSELAEAIQEKERAVKSAASANSTLEYTKDQYRTAQDAATSSAAAVANLEAENAKLSYAASGERTKLKAMHLDRQHSSTVTINKSLRAEIAILKKTLASKEDELARAKLNGGRMGVGTRATSVTPQPNRVRSRAGSPSVGNSRLSNLRNG